MACSCASYWLAGASLPSRATAKARLHSRTDFSSEQGRRDVCRGVSVARFLGAGRASRGLSLRASVKPEAETEDEKAATSEKSVADAKVNLEKDISKVIPILRVIEFVEQLGSICETFDADWNFSQGALDWMQCVSPFE